MRKHYLANKKKIFRVYKAVGSWGFLGEIFVLTYIRNPKTKLKNYFNI